MHFSEVYVCCYNLSSFFFYLELNTTFCHLIIQQRRLRCRLVKACVTSLALEFDLRCVFFFFRPYIEVEVWATLLAWEIANQSAKKCRFISDIVNWLTSSDLNFFIKFLLFEKNFTDLPTLFVFYKFCHFAAQQVLRVCTIIQ